MQRLDHVEALGVTAIWLLPFYPSPLRDDGYDISDYRQVNPSYGDMDAFKAFIKEAHRRGIRVITELVVNHTSDQHPWFQAARQAPPGSPERDFYVWSDTDERYDGTRIIFIDAETSNWAWDPVAGAYFWHRFYSHQPDLNFDNPKVLEEIIDVMRFLARPRRRRPAARRGALSVRARRHQQREPARDARDPEAHPPRRSTLNIPTACCSPRPINGPRIPAPISATATNATWRSISR